MTKTISKIVPKLGLRLYPSTLRDWTEFQIEGYALEGLLEELDRIKPEDPVALDIEGIKVFGNEIRLDKHSGESIPNNPAVVRLHLRCRY